MADVVIVAGTKRGNEYVSPIELRQMCGRAGRKHGGETATAHIIVEDDREEEVRAGLEQGANMDVHSSFGQTDGIFFHLMSEISAGRIVDSGSAQKWFARSLSSFQGRTLNFEKVFDKMEEMGAIQRMPPGESIRATKVGEIASDLYFHPGDVQAWKDNFTKLFGMGLENDNAAIAWALGTRKYAKSHGDFGDRRFIIGEYKSALPLGLELVEGTVTQVVLWWCSMGGPSVGKMRNQMLELRDDIGRIKRALVRLDKEVARWDRGGFFEDMELMIRKGITTVLVELCKLPGITKGRADFLYNAGARNAESIAEIAGNIDDEIDEPFKAALREIIHGVRRQSR